MRFFSFAAIAALSAAVMGQGISDIPKCAQACFASSLGSCGATDFACICGNTAVIDKVSCCIFATCPQADIAGLFTPSDTCQVTTQLAASLCKLANVVVNTAPICVATSAPAGLASATPSMSPAASGSVTLSGSATSSVGNGTASATSDSSSASASYAVSTGAASSQSPDTKFGLGVVVAGLLAVL
ncbi:hypothetical protein SNOG_03455 [Parastagonospora nodorum SN15]|uniref:CFEM domain-containing protein n=1 Tax=Phaeosphaeria nodorum (strain SN15 / ATCC MYA-4574 / FGSC 10173) TaxID=321614 RepID=Q0UXQ9_PHANO|nr:hypothetical protein SNOG_03455 [Parastagonospora nodorum SN15]EAT88660.1 hypothetical protein SNOG_03455 [Parastagonospora nodorum SN15]